MGVTMAINPTLALLYAQTNLAARHSHDVAVAPEVALNMSRAMAEEMARAEAKQVAKVDNNSPEVLVKDDDTEKKDDSSFGNRRRKRAHFVPEVEDEDYINAKGPFIGNLLNVKV